MTEMLRSPKNEQVFNEDPRIILEFANSVDACTQLVLKYHPEESFFSEVIHRVRVYSNNILFLGFENQIRGVFSADREEFRGFV
jgi:hypothetical protein